MRQTTQADEAADALVRLRTTRQAIPELPEPARPRSIEEAYVIQAALNRRLAQEGFGAEVGFKIGCTTAVMQAYLGIDHPCAGSLLAHTLRYGEGVYRRAEVHRPGVECEVAVDIAEDICSLPAATPEAVARFVGAARASIELVDDRWTDFRSVSTRTLVADNFFNAGCVLGPAVPVEPRRLDRVEGVMRVNGEMIGSGAGADILGHPLAALAWLAEHQIRRGAPLRAGQVVSLGSMVQTVWIETGDAVEVEVSGIGRCSLTLQGEDVR